jgi:PAS domain S-box-containing protein
MLPSLQRKPVLAALGAGIILLGAVVGAWNRARVRDGILAELITEAKRGAVAFAPADLRQLTGTKDDSATPTYAAVKARLMQLQQVEPAVHYVYLFRFLPAEKKVIFLGDSTPAGADDESLPGDSYENYQDPAKAPGLRAILADGRPATEGPEADEFGNWVTGYALVGSLSSGGEPVDILGMDMDAANWSRDLTLAALTAAGYVWTLFGVPLAILALLRRQLEQREALRNLSEAVEQSQSAIVIVDLGHRIEYANAGACRQLGYARRELLGRPWRELYAAESLPALAAEQTASMRAGRPWSGEWTGRRSSGESYPARGIITPVKASDGRVTSFVAVLDDMTAAKHAEAELQAALVRAEAGDQAKGRFLAVMSHELHTPLNGIVGFTSLLAGTALTSEQRECVDTIRLSADALLHLTGDVLDYSRIEAGRVALEPVPCDPRVLVGETLDLLAAQAAEKNLELLQHVAPDVPALVALDPGRVRQMLVNLVGNAVKFTSAGEIEVSVFLAPAAFVPSQTILSSPPASAPEGGDGRQNAVNGNEENENRLPSSLLPAAGAVASCFLQFEVRDTGPGIPAEEQARLFQPFTQLDGGIRRRHGGAGLGLAISRQLARLHGGDLTLESASGAGATFRVTVAGTIVSAPPVAERPLAGRRVALVCARPPLRAALVATLSELGAETIACELATALAARADALLLDCDPALLAQAYAGPPPTDWPVARTAGLVHAAHTAADRQALRGLCSRLLGKPLHRSVLADLFDTITQPPQPALAAPRLGLRLLLVDDNPVNLSLLRHIAATLGCETTDATSGPAALAVLASGQKFDAVLLDIHMPGMDGLEVVRRVRAGEAGATAWDIWIAMVTADQRPEMRERALAAGASDYLLKPVTPAIILAALHRRLASQA